MREENRSGKWVISPAVRATRNEDGAVLLDIEKGLCYSLNPLGMRVWQLLESDGSKSLEGIVDVLVLQFAIPREQLTEDVSNYLDELAKRRLIKADGSARPAKTS